MNSERIDELLNKIEVIKNLCDNFPTNTKFQELKSKLEFSAEYCKQQNLASPLLITLFGGTGTGKSYIFSKLCEKENLSPSSDSVRGYTKELIIAADQQDRAFVNFEENTKYVPGILDGAILVDTPDIDSIHKENATLTRKLIEKSDLLIYVASPDKRSNFEINEAILEWAFTKRWLFVLNKADTAPDISSEELGKDFRKKIESLGFKTNKDNIFVFSAREKNSFEFNRFKNYIFSKRNFKHNKLVYETACLKNALHNLESLGAQDTITEARKKIVSNQSEFNDRLKGSREKTLNSPEIKSMTAQVLSSIVYSKVATSTTTMFLFPYIWLSAKTATNLSANDLAYHLNNSLEKDIAFKECVIDEKRLLKDLELEPGQVEEKNSNNSSFLSVYKIKDDLNESIHKILKAKTLLFYNFIGNLLPLFFTVQILTRSFLSWIHGIWLPSDFFVHGIILVAGSTLPGYMLFAAGVKRIIEKEKIADFDLNTSNKILTNADNSLEKLQNAVSNFKTQTKQQIMFNEKELENSGYGTSKNEN
jgi:GTP-binding protein EngB required for normal cell division